MSTRRDFIKLGGAAGLAAALPRESGAATDGRYPVVTVAPLPGIAKGATLAFTYPDVRSPALLMRLGEEAAGGVGPDRDIVAYSTLCTHKGCTVGYKPERKLLICPCHWSTFDPAKAGMLVIGQASQHLPQIELRVERGLVQAVGISGLIYGRHTNIVLAR
ncbi:MAG: arsenate reductase (azurin) small subunit [Candidatus Rokubacteria bacterium]|nr:arsenate reductase (azurin) small subunit [Candidatus Rokubacteria bacterium]